MGKKKRTAKPLRSRAFREDSSIRTAERTIARKMGLPEGSVRLVLPSKRKARSDSTVANLRQSWSR